MLVHQLRVLRVSPFFRTSNGTLAKEETTRALQVSIQTKKNNTNYHPNFKYKNCRIQYFEAELPYHLAMGTTWAESGSRLTDLVTMEWMDFQVPCLVNHVIYLFVWVFQQPLACSHVWPRPFPSHPCLRYFSGEVPCEKWSHFITLIESHVTSHDIQNSCSTFRKISWRCTWWHQLQVFKVCKLQEKHQQQIVPLISKHDKLEKKHIQCPWIPSLRHIFALAERDYYWRRSSYWLTSCGLSIAKQRCLGVLDVEMKHYETLLHRVDHGFQSLTCLSCFCNFSFWRKRWQISVLLLGLRPYSLKWTVTMGLGLDFQLFARSDINFLRLNKLTNQNISSKSQGQKQFLDSSWAARTLLELGTATAC